MRLFNRKKEMEFDDPRLVGMALLKPTEGVEVQPPSESHPKFKQSQNLPMLADKGFADEGLTTLKRAQQPDKRKLTNASSTWKRVARPWDSLKKSESSEHLSRSVISNRRKTLHFCPEQETFDDLNISQKLNMVERLPRHQSNDVSASPKRKIGRVESLRLLLSKPNRIYRGKSNTNLKQDKGTDTQDFENENSENFPSYATERDDVFYSKYSSASSLKSENLSYLPLSVTSQLRGRFNLTKTISCENLSIQSVNQGRTLPGYRDISTSTAPILDSSCLSPQTQLTSTNTKRSSFPYAYIRSSRLSSLKEEQPKSSPKKPPRVSIAHKNESNQKQPCSVPSNFMHKGFYHSMGNLLSETKEEGHSSPVDGDTENCDFVEDVSRIFDPLKQIRIDLLHQSPCELDEQSLSSTFWGRRSYSIGEMLEKHTACKTDGGNGVEESGYDSDSIRNGQESPRNSVKTPSTSSETEIEIEQCTIKENSASISRKLVETESDSQSQSNASETSSSSSAYSFPATGGCLITINPIHTHRTPINGFRKGEDGSIIEVTTEIDQSEDCNSPLIGNELESNNCTSCQKSCTIVSTNTNALKGREKSVTLLNPKETSTVVSIEPNDAPKTAPSLRLRNRVRDKDREWSSIKPSRSKSLCLSIFTVTFTKGPRKRGLGFSIIGGLDSPVPGIFIKRIFPFGQATEDGGLTEGDEILSVNGHPLANSTHAEALQIFKSIKTGDVVLEVARREFFSDSQDLRRQYSQLSTKSCEQLHQAY